MTDLLVRWASMVGRVVILALSSWALAASADEAEPKGALSKEAVNQVLKGRVDAIKYCYEKQLQQHPTLAGTVEIGWTIEKDGQVTGTHVVRSTVNDKAVEGCIARQVAQWRFPAGSERTVVGRYPFTFQNDTPVAKPPAPAPSARIWVSRTGVIELDGKQTELTALAAALADLAKRKGVVLYGRDDPGKEPHPNGMKVIQLVIQNRLPIRMSTKRDFSDAVGADGKLLP